MNGKNYFPFIIAMLLLTDLTIVLNIPFLRQIIGFLFLTLLPGLLIVQILKLNKLDFLEKFILYWGLSISFLIFFGLLLNNLLFSLGYEAPLSTISLLIAFNIAFVILAIIGCRVNKDQIFSLPNFNLTRPEKAFLVMPLLFPAMSIFGMHVMNTTDNSIILMLLLFLIPAYVAFVCLFNQKFPKRLYPVVIFLISISLLLLLSLRSNHIIGVDSHLEYYLFQTTFGSLHWTILTMGNALDACLAISLLPTIYQSILNISPEVLFKILYSLLFSISPLAVYALSKKYVGEGYAFLASCFFMFQLNFLYTEYNPRTNTAILFFALAMMTLFNDKINPQKKKFLFIIFMASCVVSHYSTTYIFFVIMLGSFLGMEMLSKKYTVKKVVSLTSVLLFFAFIFFWYSQVTGTAFNAGVSFIEDSFLNLNTFFVEESRNQGLQAMFGEGIMQRQISSHIQFVFTWLTFVFIGIGLLTLIRRYKEMSFPELNFKKPEFLKNKFEVGYFVIALVCSGLLVVMVAVPNISKGYDIYRLYTLIITILSVFFVIGGIMTAKYLSRFIVVLQDKALTNLSLKKKALSKKQKGGGKFKESLTKEKSQNPFSKSVLEGKGSQVRAYLIILLVLIPYFLCVTGAMYNIFGDPRSVILNSEGEQYDMWYVHDQESYSAKWLKGYGESKKKVYTDFYGRLRLTSQAGFSPKSLNMYGLLRHDKIDGYIYLRYYNVVNDKLLGRDERSHLFTSYNLTEYDDVFIKKDKIYNNGGSEVYR